ncbi:MAG: hypothetical protein IPO64_17735 [Bacteroidetes bacterium]|nr:hypothetical protein [Bacteroidota bacterium]
MRELNRFDRSNKKLQHSTFFDNKMQEHISKKELLFKIGNKDSACISLEMAKTLGDTDAEKEIESTCK